MTYMRHELPTGYLVVGDYSHGQLETLSIGDYGKAHNIKADFLGYTRELNGVANRPCIPLTEKWVITVSTQYGCPMKCTFCDVPNLGFHGNASVEDLLAQVIAARDCFPSVRYTDRLNLHFARMGEPIFNPAVFGFSRWLVKSRERFQVLSGLRVENLHPVLTTSLPRKFRQLEDRLQEWCEIKNELYTGVAGLQLSINSTNDAQREEMFRGLSMPLDEVASICERLPPPIGRKYCLNFALADGYEVDAPLLRRLFNPLYWMVKITPIHNNGACYDNGIATYGGYQSFRPYQVAEADLKREGFDVIVFVPSQDEEDGIVTCGNAILAGSKLATGLAKQQIEGVTQ